MLSEFDFTITYRKGSENGVADTLSRSFEDLEDNQKDCFFREGGDVGVVQELLHMPAERWLQTELRPEERTVGCNYIKS